jgi:aminoglycoside phosphotransferase (APT) family kinase protein
MMGEPLNAALIPPQLERLRATTGLGDAPLELCTTGWNKHVLLAPDCVVLLPRHAANVEWFARELDALDALEAADLAVVPRVLGRFDDAATWPYPFAIVTRLPGDHPASPAAIAADLGGLIARWHSLPPPVALADAQPHETHRREPHVWLHRALAPGGAGAAAAEAATRLGRGTSPSRWVELLEAASRHAHVLVHGDLHSGQVLVDRSGRVSAVLDWETARVDHPFWDFDFGEWGTRSWRKSRRDFSPLWAEMWSSYALVRGLDPDPAPLECAFRLRQALSLLTDDRDPAIVGTIDEHLAAIT